jgi:hypothetical protein
MDIMTWSGAIDAAADPDEILAQADALRDDRAWADAAAAYAAFLRLCPKAWSIRVQYGIA